MLIVKVELHSAVTGQVQELGRAHICNVSGGGRRRDYEVRVLRRGRPHHSDPVRMGEVKNYPALSYNVWRLVIRALLSCFPEEGRGSGK